MKRFIPLSLTVGKTTHKNVIVTIDDDDAVSFEPFLTETPATTVVNRHLSLIDGRLFVVDSVAIGCEFIPFDENMFRTV